MPRKAPAGFNAPVQPDSALGAIVGHSPQTRAQITKKVWAYIKRHGLQDQNDKRRINADSKLALVFGRRSMNMFEMTKAVSQHLS